MGKEFELEEDQCSQEYILISRAADLILSAQTSREPNLKYPHPALMDAEILLQNLLVSGCRSALIWINLGVVNSMQKKWHDAIECYSKAIDFYGKHFELLAYRGRANLEIGDLLSAKRDLELSLTINDDFDFAIYYYNLLLKIF